MSEVPADFTGLTTRSSLPLYQMHKLKKGGIMKVEYVPSTIVVDVYGNPVYTITDGINGRTARDNILNEEISLDHPLLQSVLNAARTFYMCRQQRGSPFPTSLVPMSDTVQKLRLLAPDRAAAERAAERANRADKYSYHWIEET